MIAARPVALALLLAVLGAGAAEAQQRPRAVGGVRLIEAAEGAPATVVAEVTATKQLDLHGYSGVLQVESSLHGPLQMGSVVRIGWEELAPSRAPRFQVGDRVLVCLEKLPPASIWRDRIPEEEARAQALGVAMRGDAFLRSPGLGSLGTLEHYLLLTPEDRLGAPGVGYLVDLVTDAELPLASDALARLATRPELDGMLGPALGGRLVGALLRGDASEGFEDALVKLIGGQQLNSTRPALEQLAQAEPPPPIVFAALAELEGGLSPERTAQLLERSPPRYRQIAARHARGDGIEDRLAELLRSDPAAEVREGAILRLVELEGEGAVDPVADGLSDPEPRVRSAAARALASLGAPAVPTLLRVVDGNDREAAAAAVASLSINGSPEARSALVEIADEHPDEGLRSLAGVALGRSLGHRD